FILYNRLSDEATGTSSYQIDIPNGGLSYVIGNVIEQGPLNDNSTFIAYLEEGTNPGNPSEQLFQRCIFWNLHFTRARSRARGYQKQHLLWSGHNNEPDIGDPGEQFFRQCRFRQFRRIRLPSDFGFGGHQCWSRSRIERHIFFVSGFSVRSSRLR